MSSSVVSPSGLASSSPIRHRFFRLPFDIQEDITLYLSPNDLYRLSIVSKYLASLASRSLYSHISLLAAPKSRVSLDPIDALRSRQFSFLIAVTRHPEYTRYVRSLQFEFTNSKALQQQFDHRVPEELVWRVFKRCSNVTNIHIRMPVGGTLSSDNLGHVFPSLRSAVLQGSFDISTLDRLLRASHRLRSLDLRSVIVAAPVGPRSNNNTVPIAPLASTGNELIHFCHELGREGVQTLKALQVTLGDGTLVTPGSLRILFEMVAPHLESLELTIDSETKREEWKEWEFESVFSELPWPELSAVKLEGLLKMDKLRDCLGNEKRIGRLPLLETIRVTEKKGGPTQEFEL